MPLPLLGAHTFGFVWNSTADEALERLGEAGFRHVQLMAPPPHYDPWKQDSGSTKRLQSILGRHGMSLLALDLASNDINLARPSADVVDFAVDPNVTNWQEIDPTFPPLGMVSLTDDGLELKATDKYPLIRAALPDRREAFRAPSPNSRCRERSWRGWKYRPASAEIA